MLYFTHIGSNYNHVMAIGILLTQIKQVTHTIPTLLEGEDIGFEPQRLSTNIGLRGLTVNFYSRIIAIDIVSLCYTVHWVTVAYAP